MSKAQFNLQYKNRREMVPTIWLCGWIVLFIFQTPLESVSRVFKFLDELCAVSLIGVVIWRREQLRRLFQTGWVKALAIALGIFFAAGIAGNLLYRYQPVQYVLLDMLTNAKFYMVLASSVLVFSEGTIQEDVVRKLVYVLSAGLFAVFICDRIFDIWPGEIRRGISSAYLFYGHPTYLAGAMTFLLSLLLIFYVPRNVSFILMDLMMMACTMRSKAFGGVVVLGVLMVWVIWLGKKVKLWYLGASAGALILLAWKQIYYYYFTFSHNARAVMTKVSFRIMSDFFPIGTGFGTYASNAANIHYSPVYEKYGFLTDYVLPLTEAKAMERIKTGSGCFVYHLGDKQGYVYNELGPNSAFLNDTFWPIVIGQTGFIGTIAYLVILVILFTRLWKLQSEQRNLFVGGMFLLAYILIASTSEPAFNNAVAIPLAMVLGICLSAEFQDNKKPKGE